MVNEDGGIEYKRELTNRLKREIVSFLNSQNGGIIYLGVDDKTREPLQISEDTRHAWEGTISQWITNAFYPIPYSLIEILPNEAVFTIKVRAGRNKPYAIDKNGFDSSGVFVREGSSAVKASNERVKRMQQQYKINGEFDAEISDEQKLTFEVATRVFDKLQLDFDQNALRMVTSEGDGSYNNAALLVSDQNPYTAKLAVYDGLNVMSFKDKKEFYGAITNQIDDVLKYISLINRKQVVITGDAQRVEKFDYPMVAIREAIVNAFVHRDYLLHSDVKVELFDNRLEITSPGGIPDGLTLDEIKDGLTAMRNPRLIHILDKMHYIENYGTGIRRMFTAYSNQQSMMTPSFEVRENSFKVVLPNTNQVLEDSINIEHVFVHTDWGLNSNDELILEFMKNKQRKVKRAELEQATGLSRNKVFAALNRLQNANVIEKIGASVSTGYKLK
ncbi:ATP-binding protein [Latilactobacillus fuchuensis]|uniref:ATP-binding protein n=1 Tax=Latilactobacillus fuchuensis TaxID=164393 RepID=UPI0020C82296|nr:ATP-binding protein [Latilactobacillus fuchuensis]MCP8857440.1 putative DNA binding domain-containing protein [Latilactobacillus fuchuensis]